MTPDVNHKVPQPDPLLVDALAGLNPRASVSAVQRTRRAVRDAALSALQTRRTRRRNAGIATLAVVALLVFLSPALWSFVDDLLRGENFSDLTPMVTLLTVLALSGILAALIAGWKNQHPGRRERRNI
jgi:hypothetical protein